MRQPESPLASVTVRGAAATLLVAVLAVVALIWIFQRRLIYLPSQVVGHGRHPGVEDVTYVTDDGLRLRGWFLAADQPSGTVILFNGNAGNRADRMPLASALEAGGYSVLLVDYRGYGGNPGRPSESGLAADARAALAHLQNRPDVDPARIAYFGESLGAAVAIRLAVDAPPAALVLRSPFTSLPEVAAVHYPFLPASVLLRDRWLNVETIATVDVPVLVIAGSADAIVPIEQSRRVFDAAPGALRFVEIADAGHNDFALLAGDRMVAEIAAFLAATLPPEPDS